MLRKAPFSVLIQRSKFTKTAFAFCMALVLAACSNPAGSDSGGGGGDSTPDAPEAVFTSTAALGAWLQNKPYNTASTPYRVALKGIDLADLQTSGGEFFNPLGALFSAMKQGRYVSVDLSGCTGTATAESVDPLANAMDTSNHNMLAEVILSLGLTYTGNSAFAYCTNLAQISLPEGLTSIAPKPLDTRYTYTA